MALEGSYSRLSQSGVTHKGVTFTVAVSRGRLQLYGLRFKAMSGMRERACDSMAPVCKDVDMCTQLRLC